MSRLPSIFYARLKSKVNILGIRSPDGKIKIPTGACAITLHQIDTWWGEATLSLDLLASPFTTAEYMARYRSELDIWSMKQVRDNTLKARIRYLYESGYLARTIVGSNAWFYMPDGVEIPLVSDNIEEEPVEIERPPIPWAGEEQTQVMVDEDSEEEETFLSTLRKHGYLPEEK